MTDTAPPAFYLALIMVLVRQMDEVPAWLMPRNTTGGEDNS